MDPTQLQPGYRLDRYELLCPLAYGGMASVWLARLGGRLGFERTVVIKMILPQYSQDPRFQEMFLDEARIASRIEHPNVARILDVGEQDESYFLVMEWVDGDSLSKITRAAAARGERLPWGIALRICADAAAGLHAAHELRDPDGSPLGVVHRDVSPQNILVANNGTSVLIDFGVAKARDRVSQDTSAGQLKGKIRYMAPEQALGQAIDRRADVWAIGAILYELLAGVPPFDGPNEVASLHLLTSGQRPPPLPDAVPAVLRALTFRALGAAPADRFESAAALASALETTLVEIGQPTSAANVALYTGELLAERKASRRKAVEKALSSARDRGSMPASMRDPMGSLPASDRWLTPSPPSVHGLAESPSAASNGTNGSAALDFVPPEPETRPRYVHAALLGVVVAAGVLGLTLLLTTMIGRRRPPPPPPPPALAASAPVEAPSAEPPPTPTPLPSAAPVPAPSASTPRHRPVPAPPPKPKPTSTHPDRGF